MTNYYFYHIIYVEYSGGTLEDLNQWKKESQISFKERNWVSIPITALAGDIQERIFIDSRTMVGVMRDLEQKLEKQVQETITLKEIVRDQEIQIRKMEAMMTTQTTMLQQIMSAVIPEQVPIQDDTTSKQTEHRHIMMWKEVANVLKFVSMEMFFSIA